MKRKPLNAEDMIAKADSAASCTTALHACVDAAGFKR